MKKLFKNHCTASLLTVITGFLVLVAVSVWGMGMYCLTSVTAEYAASRYLAGYGDFASTIAQRCFESRLGKAGFSKYKNLEKSLFWKAVDTGGKAGSFYGARFIVGEGGGFLPRPDKTEVYSASAVFDAEGSLLECSWTDFFYFEYLTEGQWKNREERSGNNARAFFDREKLTEAGKELVNGSAPSMHAAAMRFTGAFDGVSFIPQKIESIDRDEFQDVNGGPFTRIRTPRPLPVKPSPSIPTGLTSAMTSHLLLFHIKERSIAACLLWPPGWEPRWFRESEQRNWSFMTV